MTEDGEAGSAEENLVALRAENEFLQGKLRAAETASREKLIQAELKAEALRAGMVDLDGLKLMGSSAALGCDEDGAVTGAGAAMAQLKRDKPWLFNRGNSSSSAQPPPSAPARQKLAMDMTLDEWRTARAELLRRR